MIVSEHEAVQQTPQASTEQPEEYQDIVKKVNELLTRSKRFRKRYDTDWHYNYEFVVNGKQWPIERPRWRFNECVNITWSTIMTEIAIQTDSRPKFEFTSQEMGDQAFVECLQDVTSRAWEKYKWSGVIQDVLFDCKLYHVAHAEIGWDENLESGLGDVCFKALDPFYVYWDPLARDVSDARWLIYAAPVPTAKLKLDYPDKADQIKPDVNTVGNSKKDWSSGPNTVYINFDPYSPSRLPSSASSTGELYGGEPMTTLVRCWMRDDTMEQLCEEKDSDTGEKEREYLLKKKYPRGRYIETANNCLLLDAEPGVKIKGQWVPFEDDQFPIARLVNYSYSREYAGENEVTHIKGPQKIVNYIWSYVLDMFRMQANPITVIGPTAEEESITNEPGAIYKADNPGDIRRETGTPITPGSFDLLATAQTLMDKIQGLQDVSRGAEVPSAGSNIMLEGYMEAAQTRPRLKNRNLDLFLQDVGQRVLMRILQFYTQPRVMRIESKEGYPSFIEFYLPTYQKENGEMVKVAKIKRISTTPEGTVTPSSAEVEVKGVPDVRVTGGSALPYAKAQKATTALTYFNSNVIDRQELLKAIDWPNFEEVLKRMEEKEAAAAQAQAQGAA